MDNKKELNEFVKRQFKNVKGVKKVIVCYKRDHKCRTCGQFAPSPKYILIVGNQIPILKGYIEIGLGYERVETIEIRPSELKKTLTRDNLEVVKEFKNDQNKKQAYL
jgi:hypothetical protein